MNYSDEITEKHHTCLKIIKLNG